MKAQNNTKRIKRGTEWSMRFSERLMDFNIIESRGLSERIHEGKAYIIGCQKNFEWPLVWLNYHFSYN